MKKDIIYDEFCKVAEKRTKANRIFLLMRYLRLKYNISIDKTSLVKRVKSWKK